MRTAGAEHCSVRRKKASKRGAAAVEKISHQDCGSLSALLDTLRRAVPRCRRHRCSRRHSQQTTADFYHASATDSTLPCSNICLLCIFLSSPYIKNYHVRQSKQYLVGFVLCTELRKFVSCFIRMSTNECTVHVWLLCYLMKMGKLVQLYTWTDQERYWVNLYVTEA